MSLPAGWTLIVRWERTPAGPVPVSGQLGCPGGALALTGEQAIALWDGAALEDVLPDFTRGNG